MDTIADLVSRMNAGEAGARDALFAAAYPELRRLAHSRLFHGGRATMVDTTALVHESYLRVAGSATMKPATRSAFFAYAAQVMRSVIIDAVRERQALRRGGSAERVTLDTSLFDRVSADEVGLLRVHDALEQLAAAEPRLAQVVEMRFFGGFTELEIATSLGLTERTVRRDWDKARLLLMTLLAD